MKRKSNKSISFSASRRASILRKPSGPSWKTMPQRRWVMLSSWFRLAFGMACRSKRRMRWRNTRKQKKSSEKHLVDPWHALACWLIFLLFFLGTVVLYFSFGHQFLLFIFPIRQSPLCSAHILRRYQRVCWPAEEHGDLVHGAGQSDGSDGEVQRS